MLHARRLAIILMLLLPMSAAAQPDGLRQSEAIPTLEYLLPHGASEFDPSVPTPEAALGFNICDRFPEWSDFVRYMEILAASSPRVAIEYFGRTCEGRQFVQISITSATNSERIRQIRQEHLDLSGCGSEQNIDDMPLVINMMASIHGNEISAATSLLAVSYYYAACRDEAVEKTLENAVIVITPGLNPDGINRFATWINANSSVNHFLTPASREYHEHSPKARVNHYWMDCNRDWLAGIFDVGRNSVEMYRYWMPNVVLDLHEMGKARKPAPLYFSPGDPNRTYQYTPERNQELTELISRGTAKALDSIGSTYYSKCNYDDFFIGKGAAYCDIQGGIGILHEQISTRGHIADFKEHGIWTFARTVRNQSFAAFGVVEGAMAIKKELLEYQRDFFRNYATPPYSEKGMGYVFDAGRNRGLAYEFMRVLSLHDIEIFHVKDSECEYAVPLEQKQRLLVKSIFEDITEYADSTFYDISTWSISRGMGANARLCHLPPLGSQVEEPVFRAGTLEEASKGTTPTAIVFSPSEYYAPYMMNALLRVGIHLQVAPDRIEFKVRRQRSSLAPGTVVISFEDQSVPADEICSKVSSLCSLCGVDARRVALPAEIIATLRPVRKSAVALVNGNHKECGALWYLFDHRFGFEHSLVDELDASVLKSCNTVFLSEDSPVKDSGKLKQWIEDGGILFLRGSGTTVIKNLGCGSVKKTKGLGMGQKGVRGVVFKADVKAKDSPVFWGYDPSAGFELMKSNADFWTVPENAEILLEWSEDPYLSGCISNANVCRVAHKPALFAIRLGKGAIVCSQSDLCYRSYWLSTSHILTNLAFFGL